MKLILSILLLFASFAWAEMSTPPKSMESQYFVSKNMLTDPGFEMGAVASNWTLSTGTPATTSANGTFFPPGKRAYDWNASAAAQTLTSNSFSVTNATGIASQPGVVSCVFKAASGTATHTIEAWDGTNVIATTAVTSSTTGFVRTSANFLWPSTGTVALRIQSQANEPEVYIDDCYLGIATGYNISNVSQTVLVASGYIAGTAACDTLTRTSTTLGAITNDAGCPGVTVESNIGPGTLQTTDVDNAIFTVNSLPPGTYKATMTFQATSIAAAGNWETFAINDGTTSSGHTGFNTSGGATSGSQISVVGIFTYTTAGNKSFQLYTAASSVAVVIYNETANTQIKFVLERYPTSTETMYNQSSLPASWSGYHKAASCAGWTRTNSAYGDPAVDADCDLVERTNVNFGTVTSYNSAGSELPGITFTPGRVGMYYVCALNSVQMATSGGAGGLRLWDGTTTIAEQGFDNTSGYSTAVPLCGMYNATTLAAKTLSIQLRINAGALNWTTGLPISVIEWSIFSLSQSFPTPNYSSPPTIQKFITGTSVAYTAPAGTKYIRVRLVGGGGGGSGGGTASANNGTVGGDTTFTCGTQVLTGSGGGGGVFTGSGGAGGAGSLGTGPIGSTFIGGSGGGASYTAAISTVYPMGSSAGNSMFGGGAGAATQSTAGKVGSTNTGGGGSGGAGENVASCWSGSSGGGGGGVDAIITSGFTSCTYSVGGAGGGGANGTSGHAGGNGAIGYIEVTEYYQ